MSEVRRLVVVGASLAGLRAVEGARKSGYDAEVVLVGRETRLPYDRPQLSKAVLAPDAPAEVPSFKTASALVEDARTTLRLGTSAVGLDTAERIVRTDDGDIGYDALVIATGSSPRRLSGTSEMSSVHTLRDDHDATRLRKALDGAESVAVVGAGFIGAEVASAARSRGVSVTILEATEAPLVRAVGGTVGPRLAELHDRNGTDLRLGVGVDEVRETGTGATLHLTDGSTLDADVVVVGIGAAPNTDWLGDALAIDDGILCAADLSAGAPGVAAAGDVCSWVDPRWGRRTRVEHWTNASEQGAHAARTVLEPHDTTPYSAAPYFWSEWYGAKIQLVGRTDGDEVLVVPSADDSKFVALYRNRGELWGALTVGRPGETNKLRRLLAARTTWDEAVEFARSRA